MRILVCGGRDFAGVELLFGALDGIHRARPIMHVVHGTARGADTMAGRWARTNGIAVTSYPADWKRHGKAAGAIRNRVMLKQENPDVVIAFPGGKGTENMVKIARKAGVEVIEITS